MGTAGLSIGDVTDAKTDYDRACAVSEYAGVIRCGPGNVLVLGDEPMQSAFIDGGENQLAIARWVYSQSDRDAGEILQESMDGGLEIAGRISFEIEHGPMVMFDAAVSGIDLIQNHNSMSPCHGLYRITTERLERAMKYCFLVHRFLRKELM
jgi:hypothetical protein